MVEGSVEQGHGEQHCDHRPRSQGRAEGQHRVAQPLAYRERMRDRGMRPIQIWVSDVRSPAFAAEAHRQSVAVAASALAADDQAFIDAVSLDNG